MTDTMIRVAYHWALNREGERIMPRSPLVRSYIERHPEDADLVDGDEIGPSALGTCGSSS